MHQDGYGYLFRILVVWVLCGAAVTTARAQITWLNWEDGDILNVSSADGLDPGHVEIEVSRSLEQDVRKGEILHHHFVFGYGLTRRLTLGTSGRHLQQKNGELFKDGLGDSNLFLKWHWQKEDSPFSFGLRQSLSIPTGYELELPGLETYTSSHNDYAAQGLFTYRTHKLGLHLNPGVILPGGDLASYLTAGAGLDMHHFLPLKIDFAGEYFTRWNMVEEKFESDVFMKFHRSLFWGLGLETGVRRRLLESASSQAEWRFGLSFGRVHDRQADARYLPPPRFAPVRLRIESVSSEVPDPLGMRRVLNGIFSTTGKTQAHGVPVYVATGRAESDRTESVYPSQKSGDYTMQVEILQVEDGRVGGFRIPMLLRAPRAEAEIHARVRLLDGDGIPVGRDEVFQAQASRGLGAQLAPLSTDFEQKVVSDEIRHDLRLKVANKLAEVILESNADVIGRREAK